jgi:ParB family chromosome partitioning protein
MQETIIHIPFEQLRPGEFQPRTAFEKEKLEGLAQSIKELGVQQPLLVRPLKNPTHLVRYEIVAGERRWRASQLVGLLTVPCYVKEMDDKVAALSALTENLNRADLNPIDEANGYKNLIMHFSYSQKEIASNVNVSESHISNLLSLLKLIPKVQQLIKEGTIKHGHGKMLINLSAEEQEKWALKARILSVRKFEKELQRDKSKKVNTELPEKNDPDIKGLEKEYSEYIGSPVTFIKKDNGKIIVEIVFHNLDILDGFLSKTGFSKS